MKSKRTLIDPIPCFMPIWTGGILTAHAKTTRNYVSSATLEHLVDREFTESSACLVGEIHDGNDDYAHQYNGQFCIFCHAMSIHPASNAIHDGGDTLIKFKIKMYNHMIDKHEFKAQKINLKKVPKIQDMVC